MIYATKKQGESNERLISRFKKLVQRSRVIINAKEKKYHSRPVKKKRVRQAAIMRDQHRREREALLWAS